MARHPGPRHASSKIVSLTRLRHAVRSAKARGRSVVLTNGCFDLLHAGHLALLEQARRLGDLLIVAINSDRSVRRLKGSKRPITAQRDRARVVAGLECVDYVTVFDAPSPQRLIERLQPDVLVKGTDWGARAIVGREVVERHGGRVVRLPLLQGYSTTRLIERLQRRG